MIFLSRGMSKPMQRLQLTSHNCWHGRHASQHTDESSMQRHAFHPRFQHCCWQQAMSFKWSLLLEGVIMPYLASCCDILSDTSVTTCSCSKGRMCIASVVLSPTHCTSDQLYSCWMCQVQADWPCTGFQLLNTMHHRVHQRRLLGLAQHLSCTLSAQIRSGILWMHLHDVGSDLFVNSAVTVRHSALGPRPVTCYHHRCHKFLQVNWWWIVFVCTYFAF